MPLPKDPIKIVLWKKRQSEAHKGQHSSPNTEFKKGNISLNKGRKHSNEIRNIMSENYNYHINSGCFKKEHKSWNKGLKLEKFSDEHKANMSKAKKGIMPKNIELLHSKENIKKALTRRIPTSLEDKFQKIVDKNNLPYKYVGNGKFFIEKYNPDFINTNHEKIAIEVYARYFKLKHNKTIEEWKEKRNKVFNNYGWKIIYFNEVEVNEKNVLEKIGGD